MMADIAKVKRNVAKMLGQNAPESDIDAYIAGEGTTIDEVRAFKDTAAPLTGSAMDAAQGYREPAGAMPGINPDGSPRGGWTAVDAATGPQAAPRGLAGASVGVSNVAQALAPQPPSQPRTAPPAATRGGMIPQGLSGVNEGIANTIGLPVDAVNSAMKAVGLPMSSDPVMGSQFWKNVMGSPVPGTDLKMIYPETDDPADRFARTAGQGLGAAVTGGAVAGAGILPTVLAGAGSGVGRATAGALSGDNPWAMLGGEMLGGGGMLATQALLARRAAQRGAEAAVPTVDDLTRQASSLYDDAERNGVTATQQETTSLRDGARTIAANEGLISPTGRVANSYPKISDALNMLDDYAQGVMTPTQMRSVRRSIQNAASSADPAERRIGVLLLEQFDQFVSPLAPQFAQANALYTRAMRGNDLETLAELAGSRAGQFTGSGYENALRTEYRGLERRIIKGDERGWTPELRQAITDVAQGTTAGNGFRNVGRMAPTGPVTLGTTVGLPYFIGTGIAGPLGGAAAAGTAAAVGYGARSAATRIGVRNAEIAELLARNGMPVAAENVTPAMARVAQALVAGQAANSTGQ